jgi:hypothetical protein
VFIVMQNDRCQEANIFSILIGMNALPPSVSAALALIRMLTEYSAAAGRRAHALSVGLASESMDEKSKTPTFSHTFHQRLTGWLWE